MKTTTPMEFFLIAHIELIDMMIKSDDKTQRVILKYMSKILKTIPDESERKPKQLAIELIDAYTSMEKHESS